MKLVDKKITIKELDEISKQSFGNMVKAVVDIEKKTMVVDAPLHSDQEAFLLKEGSNQKDLWGINLYPKESGDKFIEFDSMVNIRPNIGNMGRNIADPQICERITKIVGDLIER
jgi:hypothetical protein